MKLFDLVQNAGRVNNFNLIRIFAALAVLLSHSFPLSGTAIVEPCITIMGMRAGTIAVDVFFVTSGFLVTGSLLKRNTIEFLWARALRIYPALLVMVVFTVFGLGLFFTTDTTSSYLANHKTYVYLFKNSILVTGVTYDLPGVFGDNPLRNAVNGSLWSMPFEIAMYAILTSLWLFLGMTSRERVKVLKITLMLCLIFSGIAHIAAHFYFPANSDFAQNFIRLFFMFISGAAFYTMRNNITLSGSVFLFLIACLSLALMEKNAFFVIYSIAIPYMTLYLAYAPSRYIQKYSNAGDYSYGVYIYAFPVQQSIAALLPHVSVWLMMILSSGITLAFAALSWHFLEKYALRLKTRMAINYTL
jgi:peptidoglycan/LPS O-acetylase OafA/YrhL